MEDTREYKITPITAKTFEYKRHHEIIGQFNRWLESKNIKTVGTRVQKYEEWMLSIATEGRLSQEALKEIYDNTPSRSEIDALLYTLREVHELMHIFSGLNAQKTNTIDRKLQELVGGSTFVYSDKDNAPRNAQFELRIASYFGHRNYKLDFSTETDFIASSLTTAIFVECKRISSARLFRRRLKEAAKQIHERIPKDRLLKRNIGVTAIDVSQVIFPHNGVTIGVTNEHSADVFRKKLLDLRETIVDASEVFRTKQHIAAFIQAHMPCLIMNPPLVATRNSSIFCINAGSGYFRMIRSAGVFAALEGGDRIIKEGRYKDEMLT